MRIIILLFYSIWILELHGQKGADSLNQLSLEYIETGQFEKAFPVLKEAAELGNPEAQYNLGYCYQAGIQVEQSITKSIKWFQKSAEQGYNNGLYQMMMAYGSGKGVEQDYEKAFNYAKQCASNNDETCMFNVINCYKEGLGTEKSISKMIEWANRLGKLENPEDLAKSGYITSARLNLAYLYRDGIDIEADLLMSYHWFIIYNEFKRDFSYIQQQQIVKEIQEIEKMISPSDKTNGVVEAEKLLGRPLVNLSNLYKAEM